MIDDALFDHIENNLSVVGGFEIGSAEGQDPPNTVMFKVEDPELKAVLCDVQGESGEATFQFSRYEGGNAGDAANSFNTSKNHELLKQQVNKIGGVIGVSPNEYRLWGNRCTGVKPLNDGGQALVTWGAFFELTIKWEKV